MAVDDRLSDVADLVARHLEADAALAVAALGEPDDDAYLDLERRACEFYGSSAVRPLEGRTATPGGSTPTATIDVSDSVAPGAVYAVAPVPGADAWVALVGGKRDKGAVFVAEALLVRAGPDGLEIAGRAEWDSLEDGLEFEQSGGEAVDLDNVGSPKVLREPVAPDHAELVRTWGA